MTALQSNVLWHGDCIEVMRDMPEASVPAVDHSTY